MELLLANEELGDLGESGKSVTRAESLRAREEVRAVGGFAQLERGNGARDEIALGFAERDIIRPREVDRPPPPCSEERKPGVQLGNAVQREPPVTAMCRSSVRTHDAPPGSDSTGSLRPAPR